jgi:GAF domain-containing protein
MATAIEKLRLFEAEYTRRQEAEILREATTDVATSLEIRNLYEAILTSVERIVPHDSASIILLEEDGLRIVAGRNLPPEADYLGRLFPLNDIWISIIASRQALILKDAQSHPGWAEWDGSGYIHGWMGVPLLVRGEVIGSVCLDSKTPDAFTQEHAALVQIFANQAASAIENARLFAAERQQRQRQEAMIDLMRMVGSSLDLKEVITSVMQHLVNLVPSHAGTLQLLESGKLHLEASTGFTDEQIQIIKTIALEELPLNQQVLQTQQAAWVDDTDRSEKYVRIPGLDSFRSMLMVPLLHKDNIIGLVTLDSREPSRFGAPDADLALAIASNAAVAIENARLFEAERIRRQEADTLREATATVTSTLDQKNAVNLILEQLAKVVSYDSASVQLLQGEQLEIVGGRGWKDINAVLGMRFPVPGDNPNTVVIESRRPYILKNAPSQYSPFRTGAHQHIHSWLGVPMVIRDKIIGMLAVDSMQEDHFDEESARLVSAFANQAAAAIENSRLYQQALQASERRVILHQASQEIARVSQDLEKVYEAVHRAAARLMPAEAFVITMLDESSDEIVSVYLVDKGGKWPAVRSPSSAGLSGYVIKTGRPLIITDLERHPFHQGIHFGDDDEVRSILAVPIHSGEGVIGMISAQAYAPNVYSEEDQALLEMLGVNASVAIENSRLYTETQRRLKELEFVNHVSTQLRIAKKVSDMLPMLLDQALQVLDGVAGSIWLFDPGKGVIKPALTRGWFGNLPEEQVRPGEGIAGLVFTTGKPIVTRDFSQDPLTRESTRPQIPSGWGGACVPIRTMQETIGVMFVSVPPPHQLQDDEMHLLGTLCEIAGNALRRADLHEQTERQVQRLASLRAIDMAISTILDLRVTLGVLLDHIIAQLKVDAVDILLLNQNTQSFNHAASSGFRTDAIRHTQIFIGDELAGQAVRTRSIRYIPDLSTTADFTRAQVLAGEDFHTYFGIPLIAKGQVKGVLEIFHRQVIDPDSEWRAFLETLSRQAAIAIDNSVLFEELQQTNMDLSLAYDATIEGWSRALDLRDRETEGHTLRVTDKTLQLAQIMGIGAADRIHIRRGTLLHDIGKMGVPDSILNKEGPLTAEEWLVMRRHPEFAYEMLLPITYLRPALDIPYCHHERWDGSGYPRQLKGEQIPLVARIFAVVDVWDALTSDRPYRKRWKNKAAFAYIRDNGGILFDPRVVEQFLAIVPEDEE